MPHGIDGQNPFPFPDFITPAARGSTFANELIQIRLSQARTQGRTAGAIPLPIPVPVPVTTVPFPGPATAAANDAVFGRVAGQVAGRIVGGGIGAIIIFTGTQIFKRVEELKKSRRDRERDEEERAISEKSIRSERERIVNRVPGPANAEVIITASRGARPQFPTAPLPQRLPRPGVVQDPIIIQPGRLPANLPKTVPQPVEIPTPRLPAPTPSPVFEPIPGFGVPAPIPFPSPLPAGAPGSDPFANPFPRTSPAPLPASFPIFNPVGDLFPPRPLTPIGPRTIGFAPDAFLADQPQPQTDEARKCKEVKRRRRRKGECAEGFYKEFPGKTRFIEWRTVDCGTRSELPGDNILNFPN